MFQALYNARKQKSELKTDSRVKADKIQFQCIEHSTSNFQDILYDTFFYRLLVISN